MSAMRFIGPVLVCGCLFLFGCAKKEEPAVSTSAVPSQKPSSKTDKVTHTDKVVGKGLEAAKGDTVFVLYRGTLKNGTEFDSNMTKDKDVYSFAIGQGAVIKGWDEGVPGMRVGGERLLHVPASLGYGANPQAKIPANSDLEFDVKLLGVVKAGEDAVIDCSDIKPGSGREAKYGDTVTIQYVGTLLNGKVFEDSHYFKKPYSF